MSEGRIQDTGDWRQEAEVLKLNSIGIQAKKVTDFCLQFPASCLLYFFELKNRFNPLTQKDTLWLSYSSSMPQNRT